MFKRQAHLTVLLVLLFLLYACSYSYASNREGGTRIILVGDNGLNAVAGSFLSRPLQVKALDGRGRPIQDVPILFKAITHTNAVSLSRESVVTNPEGIATVEVSIGFSVPDSTDVIISVNHEGSEKEDQYYRIRVHQPGWIKFMLFAMLGGLAIFLFGMDVTNSALQKVAGRKMKSILSTFTANRYIGVLIGIFITAVIQSSSATTVLLVGFVSAGLMTFTQSMAVTLGAGIGTSFTVQLIAFKLTDYALMLIFIGFFIKAISKDERKSHLGAVILGFGMVFYGIKIMSDTMHPLKDYPPLISLLSSLETPFYGLIVGTLFTALIQSSGATIGIMIALANQQLITLETSIPLVLGANIGTTITALLASLGGCASARKTAWWNAIRKFIGSIAFYPFIKPFAAFVVTVSALMGSDSLPRQIANAHTFFNIALVLMFILFINYSAKLMDRLFPENQDKPRFKAHYINQNILNTPSLALEQAYREILHMSNIVEKMVINIKPALLENDTSIIHKTIDKDDKVDLLEEKITPFLTSVSRKELNEHESKRQRGMLFMVSNLEHIGDAISKELMQLLQKKIDKELTFSKEGTSEIVEFYQITLNNYRQLITAMRKEDHSAAQELAESRREIEHQAKTYHLSHIKRLECCLQESFETSTIHLDLIDCLKKINLLIVDVAEIICTEL
ncbi:MAG: Na/Pi symporter [Candidatus Wallbacteria bacterium]|nr:Na/Pi symporter [Candidatus Wallbacteria bacterium]